MSKDEHLYGQRPAKRQKHLAMPSSLDFSAQLTSFISSSDGSSSSRPARRKANDAAASSRRNDPEVKKEASKASGKLSLKDVAHTQEELDNFDRAKKKMEEKARHYAAMKRGDFVAKDNEPETLVDFDRKWAEEEEGRDGRADSSDSGDDDDDANEIIEYEDEFGRLRRGTRAEKERMERRKTRGALATDELGRMSARPAAPSKLIYGDTVQTMAFNADDPEKMEELARNRDRSPTPPDMKHYDADKEIRSKGVGFYKFSKDEAIRTDEMQSLEQTRLDTERERKEVEDRKAARRKEIEERRKNIEARRAKKMADSFLDGLV